MPSPTPDHPPFTAPTFGSSRTGPFNRNLYVDSPNRPPAKKSWSIKSPGGGIHRVVTGWGRCYATYGRTRGLFCHDLATGKLIWDQPNSPSHKGYLGDLFLTSPSQLWIERDTGLKNEGDPLQLIDARTGEVTSTTCKISHIEAIVGDEAVAVLGGKPLLINVHAPSQVREGPWPIHAPVAAADGRLYATCMEFNEQTMQNESVRLVCLNVATGETEWLIDGEYYVRALSEKFLLVCSTCVKNSPTQTVLFLDRKTGQILWRRENEVPSQPAIVESEQLLVAHVSTPYQHQYAGLTWVTSIVCIELKSGQTVWEYKPDYQINGTLVVGQVLWHTIVKRERKMIRPGIRPYYGPEIATQYLIAYDLRTHEELWRQKISGTHTNIIAFADGKLITHTPRSITCYETSSPST